jgi:hypothetical protein
MSVTPLPLFYRVNMLGFALFLMAKIFADRPWHPLLQWSGALTVIFGIVLLIMRK